MKPLLASESQNDPPTNKSNSLASGNYDSVGQMNVRISKTYYTQP